MNGLEKISINVLKDIAAGTDPTGGASYNRGIIETMDARRKRVLSGGIQTASGLLSGAIAVPMAIGSMIGGVRGAAAKGLKGVLPGMAEGFMAPIRVPYQTLSARRGISRVIGGGNLTAKELGHIRGVMKYTVPDSVAGNGGLLQVARRKFLASRLNSAVPELSNVQSILSDPLELSRTLRSLKPEVTMGIKKELGTRANTYLGSLALSGALSGYSSVDQYRKGVRHGRIVPEKYHADMVSG